MENFFRLSGFLRRKHEPVLYDVTCPQCGFAEEFEFDPHHDTAPGNVQAKVEAAAERTVLRDVAELPKVCPHCGSKLKKSRRPIFLRY